MILAVDVYYRSASACIGGVAFSAWSQEVPDRELTSTMNRIEDYQSGQFYKRELPCILKLLRDHRLHPKTIIVDGFVFLDGHTRPGLGKYLYDQLDQKIPVIGVAKRPFSEIPAACQVFRGASAQPLYVTSVGFPVEQAKRNIVQMHGDFQDSQFAQTG